MLVDLRDLEGSLAALRYQETMGRRAYALWRRDLGYEKALGLAAGPADVRLVISEENDGRHVFFDSFRYRVFAELVASRAGELRAQREHAAAALAYRLARANHLIATRGEYDEVAARLHVDEVVAQVESGRCAVARRLLEELRAVSSDSPDAAVEVLARCRAAQEPHPN